MTTKKNEEKVCDLSFEGALHDKGSIQGIGLPSHQTIIALVNQYYITEL